MNSKSNSELIADENPAESRCTTSIGFIVDYPKNGSWNAEKPFVLSIVEAWTAFLRSPIGCVQNLAHPSTGSGRTGF
jgi:hypothetical protein